MKRIVLCSWYVLDRNRLFTLVRRTGKSMVQINASKTRCCGRLIPYCVLLPGAKRGVRPAHRHFGKTKYPQKSTEIQTPPGTSTAEHDKATGYPIWPLAETVVPAAAADVFQVNQAPLSSTSS